MADTGGLNVGTLWAQIGVDTTALKSGLADVDKSMEKTASGAKQSAERTSTSWSGVGKALGGLAIAKFATDSVSAFAAAQQSTVALQDAFARFPKLSDSSAASIGKISQALADKSRFDSGAIKTGAAVLAQFGLTGKQVEATLPALVDYAAKTGKDIPAAAVALQKAALGSTKPLKDLGITGFKATGDRAKDMATVLGLVGQKTRGFADTDVHSVEGGLAVLQKNFVSVKESVGEALVPALQAVTPAINTVATAAQKGATFFGALPGPLRAASIAIAGIYAVAKIGLFSKLTAGFATFRTNMNSLRLAGAMTNGATANMGRFGAATRAAGTSLKNIGMGAFGGGLGLALVGITAAVGLFQAANERSKAAVEAHNEAVKEFSQTLTQTTGDLTTASIASLNDQLKGSDEAFKAAGSSSSDMAVAVSKGGESFYAAQQKILDFHKTAIDKAAATNQSGQYIELWAKKFGISAEAVKQAAIRGGDAEVGMIEKLAKHGLGRDNVTSTLNNYRASIEDIAPELKNLNGVQSTTATSTKETAKAFDTLALTAAKAAKVKGPEALVAGLDKAARTASTAGKTVESALGNLGVHGKAQSDIIATLGDKLYPAGDGMHYFSAEAARAADGLEKTTVAANDLVTASEALKTSLDGYTAGAGRADTATQFLQLSLDRLAGRSQQANDAHRLLETSMRSIVQTARAEAGAHDDVTRAQMALTEAKAQGVDKDHSAAENALAVRKAESDLADSIDKVTDSQRARTDADVAAKNTIIQQVAATGQAALRTHSLSESVDIAAKRMDTLRGSFIKQQIEAGKTPKQAKAIADSYGLIPKNVRTTMIVENSTANRRVGEVSAALAKLPKWQQIDILAHNKTDAGIAAAVAAINALPVQRQVSVGVTVSLLGDPAAIAYARTHGIDQRGVGHFALGGAITGGTAGVDSVPIMAMPGEHVLTARDVNRLGGQSGAYRFRRALAEGRVGKYAPGGAVPSGAALAGIPAFQPGEREGNAVGALADLASAVADFAQAAADARGAAGEARGKLSEAKTSQRQTKADQKTNVADVKRKDAEKLKAAEDALDAVRKRGAKTAAAQAAKHDAIVKAEAKLAKVRHDNAAALAKATAAQTKANNAETAKVKAAQNTYNVDKRAADQATRRAAAEADTQAREAGMRRTLTSLGRQYDQNAAKVANLSDKLADLQGKAADTTNSIAGNVAGIGGGILGSDSFTGSSTNAADMIKSLQQNLATAKGFDANIAKLVALGLNPAQAEKVANADIEGRGGVVASALAGASKAQIAQINSLLKQEAGVGTTTGKRVANAEYGAEIHTTDVQIKATQLNMKIEAAEAKAIGDTIAKATRAAMLGQTVKITIGTKELNGIIAAVVKTEHSAEVRQAAGRR